MRFVMVQLVVAFLLLAHGAVHLLFVSTPPAAVPGGSPWPFDLTEGPVGRSGRMRAPRLRQLTWTFVGIVLGGYALAALAVLGWLPAGALVVGIVVGSGASLVLMLARSHRWLLLGILIDVGLLLAIASGWRVA